MRRDELLFRQTPEYSRGLRHASLVNYVSVNATFPLPYFLGAFCFAHKLTQIVGFLLNVWLVLEACNAGTPGRGLRQKRGEIKVGKRSTL